MKGEIIYEYGKNPVNWGYLKTPDFSHLEKNISCGEEISIDFVFGENDIIQDIGFEAEGRMITIAAMSLLSEEMEDKKLEDIENIHQADILEMLEVDQLSPRRLKSAMLGLLAMRNAYYTRKNLPFIDFGDLIEEEE